MTQIVAELDLPLDVPQTISPSVQAFERREVRHRVEAREEVLSQLAGRVTALSYGVQTLYLGEVAGYRIRLRSYDGNGHWWLERKRRVDEEVSKKRWLVGAIALDAVRPEATTQYSRVAFEIEGSRITVDSAVTDGLGRRLGGSVVEIKGTSPPFVHLPEPDPSFSKFKWATGRLG